MTVLKKTDGYTGWLA